MAPDRRAFLAQTAVGAAFVAGGGALPAPAASNGQGRELDPRLLAALADAVLPESLGATGRRVATMGFADWLARYTPVVEEMHGYGYAEITYTPSDPAPGWNAQLQGLDLLASHSHGRPFAELDIPTRREVVTAALDRAPARLPASPLGATHVALALLAHWASSSEAVDLAYEAQIGRGNCRVLAETTRRPLPLAPGGTR